MKKLLTVLCLISLLLTLAVPAHAATEIHLDELDITITLPTGYDVFTRNMSASDPLFTKYNFTQEYFENTAISQSIYLDAFNLNTAAEIVVTMTTIPFETMAGLSDSVLMSMGNMIVETFAQYGVTVDDYQVYHHPQIPFLKVHYYMESLGRYSLQYYTITDGQAINFTMHKYSAPITGALETEMESVVAGVTFENLEAATTTDTDAFTYTDPELGLTFTVPENWQEKPLSENREYLDVKFVNTKSAGSMISFGTTDFWSMLSPLEQAGLTRKDLNMDTYSEEEVAELLDETGSLQIDRVAYNGVEYYYIEITQTMEVTGYKLDVTLTSVMHLRDGWLIFFQFGGTSEDPLFRDFERMLKSVNIPEPETEPETQPVPETEPKTVIPAPNTPVADGDSGTTEQQAFSLPPAVLLIVVIAAVVVILVVVLGKRKGTKNTQAEQTQYQQPVYQQPQYQAPQYQQPQYQAPQYQQPQYQQPQYQQPQYQAPQYQQPEAPQTVYCPYCGAQLPASSTFCHNCGARFTNS